MTDYENLGVTADRAPSFERSPAVDIPEWDNKELYSQCAKRLLSSMKDLRIACESNCDPALRISTWDTAGTSASATPALAKQELCAISVPTLVHDWHTVLNRLTNKLDTPEFGVIRGTKRVSGQILLVEMGISFLRQVEGLKKCPPPLLRFQGSYVFMPAADSRTAQLLLTLGVFEKVLLIGDEVRGLLPRLYILGGSGRFGMLCCTVTEGEARPIVIRMLSESKLQGLRATDSYGSDCVFGIQGALHNLKEILNKYPDGYTYRNNDRRTLTMSIRPDYNPLSTPPPAKGGRGEARSRGGGVKRTRSPDLRNRASGDTGLVKKIRPPVQKDEGTALAYVHCGIQLKEAGVMEFGQLFGALAAYQDKGEKGFSLGYRKPEQANLCMTTLVQRPALFLNTEARPYSLPAQVVRISGLSDGTYLRVPPPAPLHPQDGEVLVQLMTAMDPGVVSMILGLPELQAVHTRLGDSDTFGGTFEHVEDASDFFQHVMGGTSPRELLVNHDCHVVVSVPRLASTKPEPTRLPTRSLAPKGRPLSPESVIPMLSCSSSMIMWQFRADSTVPEVWRKPEDAEGWVTRLEGSVLRNRGALKLATLGVFIREVDAIIRLFSSCPVARVTPWEYSGERVRLAGVRLEKADYASSYLEAYVSLWVSAIADSLLRDSKASNWFLGKDELEKYMYIVHDTFLVANPVLSVHRDLCPRTPFFDLFCRPFSTEHCMILLGNIIGSLAATKRLQVHQSDALQSILATMKDEKQHARVRVVWRFGISRTYWVIEIAAPGMPFLLPAWEDVSLLDPLNTKLYMSGGAHPTARINVEPGAAATRMHEILRALSPPLWPTPAPTPEWQTRRVSTSKLVHKGGRRHPTRITEGDSGDRLDMDLTAFINARVLPALPSGVMPNLHGSLPSDEDRLAAVLRYNDLDLTTWSTEEAYVDPGIVSKSFDRVWRDKPKAAAVPVVPLASRAAALASARQVQDPSGEASLSDSMGASNVDDMSWFDLAMGDEMDAAIEEIRRDHVIWAEDEDLDPDRSWAEMPQEPVTALLSAGVLKRMLRPMALQSPAAVSRMQDSSVKSTLSLVDSMNELYRPYIMGVASVFPNARYFPPEAAPSFISLILCRALEACFHAQEGLPWTALSEVLSTACISTSGLVGAVIGVETAILTLADMEEHINARDDKWKSACSLLEVETRGGSNPDSARIQVDPICNVTMGESLLVRYFTLDEFCECEMVPTDAPINVLAMGDGSALLLYESPPYPNFGRTIEVSPVNWSKGDSVSYQEGMIRVQGVVIQRSRLRATVVTMEDPPRVKSADAFKLEFEAIAFDMVAAKLRAVQVNDKKKREEVKSTLLTVCRRVALQKDMSQNRRFIPPHFGEGGNE